MAKKKTPKFETLVVNAIRRLQDAQGLSPREITNYITKEYDVPGTEIKKQIKLALKRGVSYGILQKSKGGYYTCIQDFLKRQPLDRHDINELKCRSRRRRRRSRRSHGCMRRRRSSRRRRGRSRCIRRSGRSHRRRRRRSRSSRRRSLCKRHRRRSRRSSRRRRKGGRRRGRSMCARRSHRRRSRSRSKRRRRKRSSGRRCKTTDDMEMDQIMMMPKQSKMINNNNNNDDENNSRNETLSDRSSLTDPNGSMHNQQSVTSPIY